MKQKLSKLGYSVFEICFDRQYYRKGSKIIVVENDSIVNSFVEVCSVSNQKEIDNLQIEFNNLQRDLKTLERGKN